MKPPTRSVSRKAVVALGVALSLFHLYTAYFGVFPGEIQRSIHWLFISVLVFLTHPGGSASPESALTEAGLSRWLAYLVVVLGVAGTVLVNGYLVVNYEDILQRYGDFVSSEVLLATAAVLLTLEVSRRTLGWALPLLCLLLIAYALAGPWLPGLLAHRGYSFDRVMTYLYFGTDGIYGLALGVSATFIFLFMLFGSFLEQTGAGKFFVDLAFSLTGRVPGGPAQAAVLSSALMGTVSGSGVANVVTTGTFTIPLMKRTGYEPHFAAAVEALASNGGQLMPPVMGAVAFLMAEMLGIPYREVARAALIPAVLYFVTLGVAVYLEARRRQLAGFPRTELPDLRLTLKQGWMYLIPLIPLIALLVLGYSPMRAAFFGIVAVALVAMVKRETPRPLHAMVDAMHKAALTSLPVAAACASAGIITGILNLTGLGPKLSTLIVSFSGGFLFLGLLLTMLVSLVLGMGLPTSAAYLVLAVLGGPALTEMGVSPLAAHLFILYFGCLSTITPPVALSTYAAAGIAGSSPIKTGITAVSLGTVAFLLPYLFVYRPALLMDGSLDQVIRAVFAGLLGCVLFSVAIIGWMLRPLGPLMRVISGLAGLLLLSPGWVTDLVGLAVAGLLVAVARLPLPAYARRVARPSRHGGI